MAATSLEAIREGLAAAITAVFTDVQCTGYLLSAPTAPGFEVEPGEVEYDLAHQRGLDEWTLIVRGFVGLSADVGSQKRLDGWLASSGGESVKAAIEAAPTLGGAVSSLQVKRVSRYAIYGSNPGYLGAEWTVVCWGPGV